MDVTALYEIKNTEIGIIIIILNHDLVELQSILGCSSFCYGLCSRIGNLVGAFVKKGALMPDTKTAKILKIFLGYSEYSHKNSLGFRPKFLDFFWFLEAYIHLLEHSLPIGQFLYKWQESMIKVQNQK